MPFLNAIAEFLQTNGGWGVASIAIYALWQKDKQFGVKMDERHEEFLALLRETSDMLSSVRHVLAGCKHNTESTRSRKREEG